ncbi:MAG: transcription-repair coupling factor, partial [Actinomycetota bacterium]|nr:transcription-repair coupling factor [Actinomycetota bacterium]
MSQARTAAGGLRSLLELAQADPGFGRLARALTEGAPGTPVEAGISSGLRPYLLAALAESDPGLADRPLLVVAPDDRSARDLATELGAYLAPRRVRIYPSRGTGYESHLAPPPHLVGLRIAALDALVADDDDGEQPVVVASAVALAEAVPDASLRPAGFALSRGEEIDLTDVAELLAGSGYERCEQVTDRGQFAVRGGILDVFGSTEDRAARIELFGDEIESIRYFSTFTQRSLADAERIELDPAAEIDPDHRILAEAALADAESDAPETPLAELLPTERFSSFLDLIDESTAIVIAASEEIGPALDDHLTDVHAAIHDEDVAQLYVGVSEPLAARALLSISSKLEGREHGFQASTPVSAARSLAEAEPELEKQLRSGYVTVVAFERIGEAERAQYALERLTPAILTDGPAPVSATVLFAEAPVADGFVAPSLNLAVIPYRRLVHRRRAAAPAPSGGRLASLGDLAAGDHVVHEDHG